MRAPLNTQDFSSFLLQAQASKAKVIGLANAGGDTINSIKQASEFGIVAGGQLAGLLIFLTDIHSLGLKTAQGLTITSAWYWDKDDPSRVSPSGSWRKTTTACRRPTSRETGIYSEVAHYLKAIQAAGTDDARQSRRADAEDEN